MTAITDLRNARHFLPRIIKDRDRKSLIRIFKELIFLFFKHRTIPTFYFSRHLYKKGRNNIEDYLPNKLLSYVSNIFNDPSAAQVLKNKLFFNLFYSKLNENLPKTLMYNHKKTFVLNDKYFEINTIQEFEEVITSLINNRSLTKSIFVKKIYDSYGGRNTYRLSSNEQPFDKKEINDIFMKVQDSGYLYQETIDQHPVLNQLNNSCINSIRMDTFIDHLGNVEILSAYLRMSICNSHVDNTTSGGCFVGVSLETGKLKKYGYTSITRAGGKILTEHPVSGTVFENFTIPLFTEAKELVQRIAPIVPNLRLIGWDIAISRNGPILIEGNTNYDITNHDLAYGGYKSHPGFKKVLDELKML